MKNKKSCKFCKSIILKTYENNKYWRQRKFCSLSCSNSYNKRNIKLTKEHKKKIGKTVKGRTWKLTEKTKRKMSLIRGGTGISYENSEYGSEFDSSLKEKVRFRNSYKCQFCGCSQIENGRQLDCHHIDYNKKNNNTSNLISLCRSCHIKTNYKREYWKNFLEKGI